MKKKITWPDVERLGVSASLRKYRAMISENQHTTAKLYGVSPKAYCNWEEEKTKPSLSSQRKILAYWIKVGFNPETGEELCR